MTRGSFLSAFALLEAYGIESKDKLKYEYYYGEYLSQGRMTFTDDVIAKTSLEALITHGLYELYAPFKALNQRRLYLRVL